MLKAILVDDETVIREGIRDYIDWEELGFHLIATCENGKEAMEEIQKGEPDVVITDICMPYADGLEVAKFVYETYPKCKVIILSGYDNFEYARQAIRYQVMKYILKPVTANQLRGLLVEVREEVERGRKEEAYLHQMEQMYEKHKPYFKERFLNQMMRGTLSRGLPEEFLDMYGITLEGEYFSVAQLYSQHIDEYDDLQRFILFNITEELTKEETGCLVFLDMGNITTFLFSGESEYHLEKRVQKLGNQVLEILNQYLRDDMMLVVGKNVSSFSNLSLSYQNVQEAKEYGFLFEKNSIIFGKELIGFYRKKERIEYDWAAVFVPIIKKNDKPELKKEVKNCFDFIKKEYMTRTKAAVYVQTILMKLLFFVEEAGIHVEKRSHWEKSCLEASFYQGKLEEMEQFLCCFCEEIGEELSRERNNLGKNIAACAMDYIQEQYQDSELSLQQVCKYLAISTSYFSALFKHETGKTFVEALTECRIEKAKELLKTTRMKSYEVAESVGYGDAHYFSSIFKKNTGMTPKEYGKKWSLKHGGN